MLLEPLKVGATCKTHVSGVITKIFSACLVLKKNVLGFTGLRIWDFCILVRSIFRSRTLGCISKSAEGLGPKY